LSRSIGRDGASGDLVERRLPHSSHGTFRVLHDSRLLAMEKWCSYKWWITIVRLVAGTASTNGTKAAHEQPIPQIMQCDRTKRDLPGVYYTGDC
jgi:hypothetical protein